MVVNAVAADRADTVYRLPRLAGSRKLDDFVIVELLFEVFAGCEEVEKLVSDLLTGFEVGFVGHVVKFFKKAVLARAASLDLNEVRGGKDGSEESEVEDVGAVVSGGHHADGHADAGLAGLVRGQEVCRAEQTIVGEVDGHLLGVIDLGRNLCREVGLIPAGEHPVGHLIENLSDLSSMVLAHGKNNRFADFAADWVAESVFKEGLAKKFIGGRGKELFLEVGLFIAFVLFVSWVVLEIDDKALLREKLRSNASSGIYDGWINEVALFDAVEQCVTECGLAVLAAEGSISVEQETPLVFAWVFCGGLRFVELLKIILWRCREAEFVADEVVKYGAGVSADGAVCFVGYD